MGLVVSQFEFESPIELALSVCHHHAVKAVRIKRYIARHPVQWVAFALIATVVALVLFDWQAELAAWTTERASGFPLWAIIGGFALGWLRIGLFWFWLFVVGFLAWSVRRFWRP